MKIKALSEPKQRKAFQDKYLAAVLAVAALLISFFASAQTDSLKYSRINGYGFMYKRWGGDSVLMVPLSTSPHIPYRMGAIRYRASDSTLQLWTGHQWNSILTGVGNGIDTAYAYDDSTLAIETPNRDYFIKIKGKPSATQLNDSSFIVGRDTITIRGIGSGAPSGPAGGALTGTYPNPSIADDSITTTKFRQSAPLSVMGNPSNSTDYPVDISAANDGNVLRRFGTSLGFGAINLANSNAVTGLLPIASGGTGTSSPGLVNGSGISITGTWPNQTISTTGSGISGLTAGRITISTGSTTIGDDANLLYNSTTNKITTDSLVIKKGITDSLMMGSYESDLIDSATFFGTSITAGSTAIPLASKRYSAIVSAGLRVNEINKGQGGYLLQHSPSWPLTNTFKDHYTELIQPKSSKSRYLFFAWGENDANAEQLYGGLFGVDTAYFKRDYLIAINYALSLGWSLSDMRIISPFWQLISRTTLTYQQRYYDAAKHFADSMGIQFIDVFHQGKDYDNLILDDDIHPSNYGHSIHAYAILKAMNQPLQAKTGENFINSGISLFSQIKLFPRDTATIGYSLTGVNPDGEIVKVPPERFLLLDNTDVPVQPGNASVKGNVTAGKQLRAEGDNGITTGAGFEISYDGSNGKLIPYNRGGPSFGHITMPFSKLHVGGSITSPFSQLYVSGSTFSRGLYVASNPNVMYNTSEYAPTLNLLTTIDSIGSITMYGAGGYRPLALNGYSTNPVYINTFNDNGSGARLQINGDATVADETYDATAWNGSLEVPTKNAVRDKIESLSSGITSINSQTGTSQLISGGAGISVSSSSDVHTVSLNTDLDAQVSDANNSGTSATDLYSKTIAANQLTLNGQSIHFEAAGINNDATATVNLEALFAGNGIAGTGAVTISATGAWTITGTIIRATSTTARVYTTVTIDQCTQKVFLTTANLTGLDWTSTNILKIRATAGGGGGGSNDITAQMWKVVYQP